ncbi:MAG: hypothetical protein NC320_03310 [Clostridium sp.]|nr:hypothetical protein [Clostridium sp.]
MPDVADILSQLLAMEDESFLQGAALDSIDSNVAELLKVCKDMSMSNANGSNSRFNNSRNGSGSRNSRDRFGFGLNSPKDSMSQFKEAFTDQLLEGFLGSDFKNTIKGGFEKLASDMGVDLNNISGELGKELGKKLFGTIKESQIGGEIIGNLKSKVGGILSDAGAKYASAYTAAGGSAAGASAALSGVASAASVLGPYLLGAVAAVVVVKKALDALSPAIEGAKKVYEAASKAKNRYNESQKKNLELAQKRLTDDVESMIKAPFEILDKAAQKWYDTWDNNLRVINGTQGYNKAELQSLTGSFAERLRQENLTNVVSSADITDNLTKVLEAGLSGTIAEEFAYTATKLNAAIPTQDFFSYVDTYASIAANAVREGKSQSDAISYANSQLELFAGNLLYAGREVAGGFTTGLKNAESLFTQSVQIAQAAKTNNAAEISGVMTAVSAVTGAIAPDLANAMTDAVYKAAVGGNSSEIVALRSLAGINASNTEFLRQLSANPKEVFVNLFSELSKRQNMSEDAYMEVAEGLSSIFGVSMDAFARVDFAYLAQAIASMNTTNNSLSENMALLVSGETTTNAEQLKMQQINKYMLDEGLAYVLDNETARVIQQHMWDEQIARDIMEATYGVEIQGAALEFLEGIRQTIDNILGFLNPFKLLGKIANLRASAAEGVALEADITGLLEAGKVGSGSAEALYQLTTRNRDLNLTDSIVDLMGGHSAYEAVSGFTKLNNALNNPFTSLRRAEADLIKGAVAAGLSIGSNEFTGKSAYSWGTIGKSTANALTASTPSGSSMFAKISDLSNTSAATLSNSEKVQNEVNEKVNKALGSMSDFVKNDTERKYTYDDWEKHVSEKFFDGGDFKAAVEGAGLTIESVKGQFDTLQTQVAAQEKLEREKREETFWENNTNLLTTTTEWLESINTHTENIFKKFEDYFTEWTKYFIDHEVYNSTFTHEQYDKIARQEKENSETAVYALADALTQNDVKLLLDPTVQTNALLAQILKVAVAILEQSKDAGASISLADTIAGLSLGIVNT